jgi:hypothetical protein
MSIQLINLKHETLPKIFIIAEYFYYSTINRAVSRLLENDREISKKLDSYLNKIIVNENDIAPGFVFDKLLAGKDITINMTPDGRIMIDLFSDYDLDFIRTVGTPTTPGNFIIYDDEEGKFARDSGIAASDFTRVYENTQSNTTIDYILIKDEKEKGTQGNTPESIGWNIRPLTKIEVNNEEVLPVSGMTETELIYLEDNYFRLAPGKYRCAINASCYGNIGKTKIRLKNQDTSTILVNGLNYIFNVSGIQNSITANGKFEITEYTDIVVEQYVENIINDGFGKVSDFDDMPEIYMTVEMFREGKFFSS